MSRHNRTGARHTQQIDPIDECMTVAVHGSSIGVGDSMAVILAAHKFSKDVGPVDV